MPKPPPRNLNSPVIDFFIKWTSRGNTWLYKITGGKAGSHVQKRAGRPVDHHRPQNRPTPRQPVAVPAGRREGHRRRLEGRLRRNPMWYLNLKADPKVSVQIKDEVFN